MDQGSANPLAGRQHAPRRRTRPRLRMGRAPDDGEWTGTTAAARPRRPCAHVDWARRHRVRADVMDDPSRASIFRSETGHRFTRADRRRTAATGAGDSARCRSCGIARSNCATAAASAAGSSRSGHRPPARTPAGRSRTRPRRPWRSGPRSLSRRSARERASRSRTVTRHRVTFTHVREHLRQLRPLHTPGSGQLVDEHPVHVTDRDELTIEVPLLRRDPHVPDDLPAARHV